MPCSAAGSGSSKPRASECHHSRHGKQERARVRRLQEAGLRSTGYTRTYCTWHRQTKPALHLDPGIRIHLGCCVSVASVYHHPSASQCDHSTPPNHPSRALHLNANRACCDQGSLHAWQRHASKRYLAAIAWYGQVSAVYCHPPQRHHVSARQRSAPPGRTMLACHARYACSITCEKVCGL